MVCNEVQWSATSCNNRAKRIVLSTKQHWLSVAKVVHNFFAKKSLILKPSYKRPSILDMKRLPNSLT